MHDAGCSSDPTLALPLQTSVGTLAVETSLTVAGESVHAPRMVTPYAVHDTDVSVAEYAQVDYTLTDIPAAFWGAHDARIHKDAAPSPQGPDAPSRDHLETRLCAGGLGQAQRASVRTSLLA